MSRFYVGQRVRVVCPTSKRHGEETVVSALGVRGWTASVGEYAGVQVALAHSLVGTPLIFEEHELEPITPPRVAGSREVIEQLLPNIREGVAA